MDSLISTPLTRPYWLIQASHVVMGMVVVVVTLFVAHGVKQSLYKKAKNDKNHDRSFAYISFAEISYYTITVIGFLIILRIFGFETTSLVALVSAFAFALGLSLQGSLSDIASGILITFFNIYSIGDVVSVNDTEGKVLDFKLIHTILEEINTKSILTVPNRTMQGSIVSNITKQGYHYFMIDILLSNKNKNFDDIRGFIRTALKDSKLFPDVLQNVPHRASILDMTGVGTKMRIRVPVNTLGDIAVKRGDIRNALRAVLETKGVMLLDPTAITL